MSKEVGQIHRQKTERSPRSLANLKPPWKKGECPNPGGRPKGRTVTAALRDLIDHGATARELAAVLVDVGLGRKRARIRDRVDTIEKIIKVTDGQRLILDAGEGLAELAAMDPVDLALARAAMLRKMRAAEDDDDESKPRRGRNRRR